MGVDQAVARGHDALAAGRWGDARACFESALDQPESPEVLLGLADALFWLGDAVAAIDHLERAYAVLRRGGDTEQAAMIAIWVSVMYRKCLGNQPASGGWAARAAGLVGADGPGQLRGWLCYGQSLETGDIQRSVELARQALQLAREAADRDLELCAMAELGAALVVVGEVATGLSFVDEAMAATYGGEYGSVDTVVTATCSMLVACDRAADLGRIQQWCAVADDFMKSYGSPLLYADCRGRYGSVLLATGHWAEAEVELRTAMRIAPAGTTYHGEALSRLAELRLRQGRSEEAASLLAPIVDLPGVRPLVAALHHARGEDAVATAILHRYADGRGPNDPDLAPALDLLVAVQLAGGHVEAAGGTAQRLADLDLARRSDRVAAHSAFASGRLAAATGEDEKSTTLLERAMEYFATCHLSYEAALVRLELARVLAAGHPEVAIAEAQGAITVFERLGATPAVDEAAALLRSLGAPARTGPKDVGVLTQREQEVFRLLAAGLSNPEIARRLFLSTKTVSHHVSHVFGKLGLRNRAEAAAHAARLTPEG